VLTFVHLCSVIDFSDPRVGAPLFHQANTKPAEEITLREEVSASRKLAILGPNEDFGSSSS